MEATPEQHVVVPVGPSGLPGDLHVPSLAGVVAFAHGSGSSRLSPRNRWVAGRLRGLGLGTLLFDLLTPEEATDRTKVFDIALLGERLAGAVAWLTERLPGERVGLFGASTGAGAALWAAGGGSPVHAVVSRGGRPDLASGRLGSVTVPTLLIVGGADTMVLALNREAGAQIAAVCRLAVVRGAGHLFEEPGALEQVSGLAGDWFSSHLIPRRGGSGAGARRVLSW